MDNYANLNATDKIVYLLTIETRTEKEKNVGIFRDTEAVYLWIETQLKTNKEFSGIKLDDEALYGTLFAYHSYDFMTKGIKLRLYPNVLICSNDFPEL